MVGNRLLIVLSCVVVATALKPMPEQQQVKGIPQVVEAFQIQPTINYRLPNNTRPVSYDIHLTTNVHTQEDFNFTGQVAIRLVAIEASRTITVHQRQLTIGTVSLSLATSPTTPIALNPFEYDSTTELLTFTLSSDDLVPNIEYILTIAYSGVLRTGQAGFYRSSYLADDGSRR